MSRKIIQIAATPDVEIIALCNDGSVWICHHNGITLETWLRLPDIPQHDGKRRTSADLARVRREARDAS